ncbi:gag-pol polyprotein [Trifolium medium]|uniref:Gag-pol polyprotein n=1 Tax=Trifolium medium TaxID=97028 RepID=A0A392PAB3_9FABA|nr:gag-pol polyprotein [Trifolium medium]
MDLMGQILVEVIGGKRYALVVNGFSRFTWIEVLREKSETVDMFKELCLHEKGATVVRIISNHGGEFEKAMFSEFCASEGINYEFSFPITPQQNGVVERNNKTIQESARSVLHAKQLPYHFWAEANEYNMLSDREQRRKMDPKSEVGTFLGYSTNSRACRVYNLGTKVIMESINVVIDDAPTVNLPDASTNATPLIPQGPYEVKEGEPLEDKTDDDMVEVRQPTASK